MITTIEIIQESTNAQQPTYRAICGDQQVGSPTPGQALDTLERMLAVHGSEQPESTLIVVQRFRPDAFFTAQQQTRLQELMDRFHHACEGDKGLSSEEKQELEQLVDTEWQAAIERGAAILGHVSRSTS